MSNLIRCVVCTVPQTGQNWRLVHVGELTDEGAGSHGTLATSRGPNESRAHQQMADLMKETLGQ